MCFFFFDGVVVIVVECGLNGVLIKVIIELVGFLNGIFYNYFEIWDEFVLEVVFVVVGVFVDEIVVDV